MLENLEIFTRQPVAQSFSLISGTSIGGINALAVSAEIPAEKISNFYLEHGSSIFPKGFPVRLGLFGSRYTNKALKVALDRLFEDRTIADLQHPTIIPAVNYTKGGPQVFKTPHHPSLHYDSRLKLVDVALATSAAPTYFPIHRMECGDMVDGGLIANNPALFAYIEARSFLDFQEDKMRIIHIGTMSSGISTSGKSLNSGYLAQWRFGQRLIDLFISSQERSIEYIMGFYLKDRYLSIDALPTKDIAGSIGLDIADDTAKSVLKQNAVIAFNKASKDLPRFNIKQWSSR